MKIVSWTPCGANNKFHAYETRKGGNAIRSVCNKSLVFFPGMCDKQKVKSPPLSSICLNCTKKMAEEEAKGEIFKIIGT